jgi:hypothetical protein
VNGILTTSRDSPSAYKGGPDADDVQSQWVKAGKACGLIVENSPRRRWKEPVSTAHNGINNAAAGCG